jgi:hypothetical protein
MTRLGPNSIPELNVYSRFLRPKWMESCNVVLDRLSWLEVHFSLPPPKRVLIAPIKLLRWALMINHQTGSCLTVGMQIGLDLTNSTRVSLKDFPNTWKSMAEWIHKSTKPNKGNLNVAVELSGDKGLVEGVFAIGKQEFLHFTISKVSCYILLCGCLNRGQISEKAQKQNPQSTSNFLSKRGRYLAPTKITVFSGLLFRVVK